MKNGTKPKKQSDKESANLSVDRLVKGTLIAHIATNKRRKGCRNLSELTEQLWMAWLRKRGVKLPPGCKALLKA